MARVEPSHLRSAFLRDLKDEFSRLPRFVRDRLEFDEEQNESVLDELLEVVCYVSGRQELFVYQRLTIRGDQVATYTVRENVTKRMDRSYEH